MKNLALVLLVLSLFSGSRTHAQEPGRWHAALFTGITTPLHDIRRAEWVSNADLRYQLGAHLEYWHQWPIGARLQLSRGQVHGMVLDTAYLSRLGYPSGLNSQTEFNELSLQLQLNVTGWANRILGKAQANNRFHLYTAIGLGVNNFEVRVRDMATGLYLPDSVMQVKNGRSRSLPFSLGISYKVRPNFHINVQGNMHFLHTDHFDGWANTRLGDTEPRFGRGFDRYASGQISFVFLLGKGNSVYWTQ